VKGHLIRLLNCQHSILSDCIQEQYGDVDDGDLPDSAGIPWRWKQMLQVHCVDANRYCGTPSGVYTRNVDRMTRFAVMLSIVVPPVEKEDLSASCFFLIPFP